MGAQQEGSDESGASRERKAFPRFSLTPAWPERLGDADGEELLAFWKREGAIVDEAQARARLKQVVFLARSGTGEIAGVCTALPITPPQLGQPMYFWRSFIGANWRHTRLINDLLARSCEELDEYAAANGYPAIGILLELENERFRKVLRKAEWAHPHFTYIGRSPRGLDVRVHYFKGARLKDQARVDPR